MLVAAVVVVVMVVGSQQRARSFCLLAPVRRICIHRSFAFLHFALCFLLAQEIILVDDGSDAAWLQKPLEDYIRDHLPPFVRLVRHGERRGLIRARLTGAKEAQAPILTFLDSHIEVTEGWLPPLLERVSVDPTVAACPIITVIGQEFLEHQTSIDHANTACVLFAVRFQ